MKFFCFLFFSSMLISPLSFARSVVVAEDMISTKIINGEPVKPGTWTQVVRIRTGNSMCTATIVGEKVLITAAHCGDNGNTSTFTFNGVQYSGEFIRSRIYPSQDHDVAIIVLSTKIEAAVLSSIGGTPMINQEITILGYGCTQEGGSGGNDGILRIGKSRINGFEGYDIISSNPPSGAALCYGDSGGPLYIVSGGVNLLAGINSKGNIRDKNWNTNLNDDTSIRFLKDIAALKGVEICGINKECSSTNPTNPIIVENKAIKIEAVNKGLHNDEYIKRHLTVLAEYLLPKDSNLFQDSVKDEWCVE